ncbi:MAG: hypothetical protein ACE14P_06255 [Methanotrichaceae archaeon]
MLKPKDDDGEDDFTVELDNHRSQLIIVLKNRKLGPSGQRLYHWLKTGEGWDTELEALLRGVCAKVPAQVFIKGQGVIEQGCLDPDQIIKNLPQDLLEDAKNEALNRFGFGMIPKAGDDELLADLLEPEDMMV